MYIESVPSRNSPAAILLRESYRDAGKIKKLTIASRSDWPTALERVALVGDRGMITQARLDAEIAPAGLDWITALRAPAIRTLVEAGALQMSLFDQHDMAAITSPDYPGER